MDPSPGRWQVTNTRSPSVRAATVVPRDLRFTLSIRGPETGDAATRAFVSALRDASAHDDRIAFAPAVVAGQTAGVLAAVDILIVPSVWFENGPTVALEAMAVGTPVLASRIGNLPEIIADGVNGRLIEPGDIAALARAIAEIAADPAATVDVWRRGLAAPRTMDDVARDYLSLYVA
jgi:glycosyltransferase involved in cell wall biosynthesis